MADVTILVICVLFALSFVGNALLSYLLWRLDPELPNGLSNTLYAIVCGDQAARSGGKYAMRTTIDDDADEGTAAGGGGQESKEAPPGRQASVRKHKRKATLLTVDDVLTSNQQWEIDPNKLRMKSIIGKGNFGEVWLALWLGSPVAVKTILARLQDKEKLVDRFIQEIIMMSVLHHPNVVLFLGACTKKPNLCLVLEYCTHRSLHHFLKNEEKHHIRITMSHVLRFALDIARGVYYLHRKQSIVQRDLKARNILVDESLNAKVADFGLSRVIDEEEANKLTACGTPAWTAPEVVRMEQYTEKVDVYSFGIIMWELITRQEPYGGRKGVQIAYAAAEQGLRPEVPSYCPEDYAELMQECWQDKPADRPTFSNILKRLFQLKKRADAVAQNALPVLKRAYLQAEAAAEGGTVVNINATMGRPAGPMGSAVSGTPKDDEKAAGSGGGAAAAIIGKGGAACAAQGGQDLKEEEDLELPRPSSYRSSGVRSEGSFPSLGTGAMPPAPDLRGGVEGVGGGAEATAGTAAGSGGGTGIARSFELLPTATGVTGEDGGPAGGGDSGPGSNAGIELGGSLLSFGAPLGSTPSSARGGGLDSTSPAATPAGSRPQTDDGSGSGTTGAEAGPITRRSQLKRENTTRGDRELREHFSPLPNGAQRTKSSNTMSMRSEAADGEPSGKDEEEAAEARRQRRRERKREEALEAVKSAVAQGVVTVQAPEAEAGWDGSVSSDDSEDEGGEKRKGPSTGDAWVRASGSATESSAKTQGGAMSGRQGEARAASADASASEMASQANSHAVEAGDLPGTVPG